VIGKDLLCLVPSLLARMPKFTVGLGDTATAAAFYEEVLAIKKWIRIDCRYPKATILASV